MAYLKFVILLCAAAAASAASIYLNDFNLEQVLRHAQIAMADTDRHIKIIGTCKPTDGLLYKEKFDYFASPNKVRDAMVQYPPYYAVKPKPAIINCIKVTDLLKSGKNGYFYISQGKIGEDFVRLELKSQRGGALKFLVEFYGVYKEMA